MDVKHLAVPESMLAPQPHLPTWPPQYAIRLSTRAKRITVQISPQRGLEVVLPKRKRPPSVLQIEDVLQTNQTWIKKHLALWHQEQSRKQQLPLLPEKLSFPSFEKEILLEYYPSDSIQVRMKCISEEHTDKQSYYILSGAIQNTDKVTASLKKLLFSEAHKHLIPWLHQLSLSTGLFYTVANIRSQTSLWGSCTASKNISLNAKLLFLPKELVEYVLLHELCHTRHMNHSAKFWNLLKQFDPHCLAHRRALRHAAVYLPRWID